MRMRTLAWIAFAACLAAAVVTVAAGPTTAEATIKQLPLACDDCEIAGECYTDGETNPDNVCQICDVQTSPIEWTDNDGVDCDDQNACTTSDVCEGGGCSGETRDCDDANDCTDDSCDPDTGCYFEPNTDPCDDGDACTSDDQCRLGVCVGTPKDCQDLNVCTDDICDPATGDCSHPYNTAPCDDGVACTTDDVCATGECAGTDKVCDDANECTDDSCDEASGDCVFAPNTRSCSDGLFCNGIDTCAGGDCTVHSGDPCGEGLICDEEGNQCLPDGSDDDDDDDDSGSDDDSTDETDQTSSGGCSVSGY